MDHTEICSGCRSAAGLGIVVMVLGLLATGLSFGSAGAASPHITSVSEPQILFYWGHYGRNRLDTVTGTVTKDLIGAGQATAPLVLSPPEVARIVALADSVGFFDLPFDIHPSPITGGRTPCSSYLLRIVKFSEPHAVRWDDCESGPSTERDRVRVLGRAIERLIEQKGAFLELPKAIGAYQ